jgi:hypothetical protein
VNASWIYLAALGLTAQLSKVSGTVLIAFRTPSFSGSRAGVSRLVDFLQGGRLETESLTLCRFRWS